MGKLRLLVPALGGPPFTAQPLPVLEELTGVGCPISRPCPSSLCFLICWFDHVPGFFLSLLSWPCGDRLGAWEGSCSASVCAVVGGASHGSQPVLLKNKKRDRPCPMPSRLAGWRGSSSSRSSTPASQAPRPAMETVLGEVLWEAGLRVCLLKLPLASILGQHSDTPAP